MGFQRFFGILSSRSAREGPEDRRHLSAYACFLKWDRKPQVATAIPDEISDATFHPAALHDSKKLPRARAFVVGLSLGAFLVGMSLASQLR